MKTITLTVDDLDYDAIQREFAQRQALRRPLPDGDSDRAGAMVAEMARDIEEYRSLHVPPDHYPDD